ncbi:MAG: adenylate/guanylate cyclase domain-containing protein [Burkholderiaceae bacterium]|nr:adenylate/guanylate cyclase domain-containing protein [Burkholderiaceae bacterium]
MPNPLERLRLRFVDPAEEAAFGGFHCLRLRHHTGIALLAGAMLVALFAASDWLNGSPAARIMVTLRLLVIVPLMLAAAWAVTRPWVERVYEPGATAVACLIAVLLAISYARVEAGIARAGLGIVLLMLSTIFIVRLRFRYFAVFSLVAWAAFLAVAAAGGRADPGLAAPAAIAVTAALFLGLYGAWTRESESRREFRLFNEVADGKQRIEDLLHSMLPGEIVDRIQRGESPIADAHREVSIVFADLVGFTTLSRHLSAPQVVQLLDRLFSDFDRLAAAHGVERIKTIGDAYMAVCGIGPVRRRRAGDALPGDGTGRDPWHARRGERDERDDGDHADRAARFALALQAHVAEVSRETGLALNVRIGLHVGPVIAGVIGTRRPAFDCWGETVNLASRLESSGSHAGVHISEAAWQRLRADFVTRELPPVALKGVGEVRTYLLEAAQG